MRALHLATASLLALAVLLGSAVARDVTADERAALGATVERFDAAMKGTELDAIADTVPPKMIEFIATQAGVEVSALREVMINQIKAALAEATIASFGMDIGAAEFAELSDGEPYALIPTETVVKAGGEKAVAKGNTLALLDGGKWYLVRVSEAQQVVILRQVYPAFATVEFPIGTTEPVKD